MPITMAQVAELRQRTSCGIVDCKKSLEEAQGDMEKAIELLRKKGMAKAVKQSGRIASEGLILGKKEAHRALLLEVNCETDFVARNESFIAFCNELLALAFSHKTSTVADILTLTTTDNKPIETLRQELVAKLGENVSVRRLSMVEGDTLGLYIHGNRIGVAVALQGGNETLAKDIAMHIAASKPQFIAPESVDSALLAKEREIYATQAAATGKPQTVIDKMVEGRLKKFASEICLIEQPFVKDPNITVKALLDQNQATVTQFIRLELGEGIEKEKKDFAEEVLSQIKK